MLIDAHCHLNYWKGEALDRVIQQARDAGVELMHTVGTTVDSSIEAARLAVHHEGVYAGVGIHPWYAQPFDEAVYDTLSELASQDKVISICEIGLDYTRNPDTKVLQQEMLRQQIRLARALNMPIMVHGDVPSQADMLKILKEENAADVGGVIHGFRGDQSYAWECLAMEFYLSFGKAITRAGGEKILEVAINTPEQLLLIETDSAGEEGNGPHTVAIVAEAIAREKDISIDRLGEIAANNFKRLFNT